MESETDVQLSVTSEQRVITSEEFIVSSGLFANVAVNGFNPPQRISFECDICQKETTWVRIYDPMAVGGNAGDSLTFPDRDLKSVAFRCHLCGDSKLCIVYREMKRSDKVVAGRSGLGAATQTKVAIVTEVMKIGQYPPPSISISRALQKALGKDASALYRKALMSRNSGFGLAAVGYMRRVVEDKTNELIEIAARFAEANSASADTVTAVRKTIDPSIYTPYENKLCLAATVFPSNLKVGDVNPLQVLFTNVSKGLHGLSEEECIDLADNIRTVFEYVFENLKAQLDNHRAFVEKLKKLL